MRVYIDTSVVGGCFDEEFNHESVELFEMAKAGKISLLISNVLADELIQAPEVVQKIIADLPQSAFELVNEDESSRYLRDLYLEAGIVGETQTNDAHHVAIATISKVEMIVSWNFKHIVHYDKIRFFNEINKKAGYSPIQIYSPLEVV